MSHARAHGLRVLTPIQEGAEERVREEIASFPLRTANISKTIPKSGRRNVLFTRRGSPDDERVRFLYIVGSTVESVEDCRDAKGRSDVGGRDGDV